MNLMRNKYILAALVTKLLRSPYILYYFDKHHVVSACRTLQANLD